MIKILFFALAANVATASACAAMVRASGHKARAVDATLLTKSDREAVDLVFCHEDAAAIVHAAYDDTKVVVLGDLNPIHFVPDQMKAAEAWLRGDGDEPIFGTHPAPPTDADGKRLDGPTVADFVAAGYKASNYPPCGYASRSTDEEIAEAVAKQKDTGEADANGDGKVTAAELKEALTAKGIAFKGNASKADLQALLSQSN